jgi:4-amino-4-deoxy-L-arabinose transferase-like glycosyltransferase
MPSIQDLVHKFEEKGGAGVRIAFVVLLTVTLMLCYNWRAYRNMGSQEAMDAAQVGRNIAEGHGFKTQFIRPFSVYLVKSHNQEKLATTETNSRPDFAQLKAMHPDLANPPVYPLVLGGLMKVLPFKHQVNVRDAFWSIPAMNPTKAAPRQFWRYQPDFLIGLFNQVLLIIVAVLTFLLARRLFDSSVAWMSFALVLFCELLWQFSVSGLSTMLLMVIFMGLVWCLVWIESEEREPVWGHRAQTWLAIAIGLLMGIGMLTRYSFGWLIIPVLIFLGIFCAIRRNQILIITSAVFLLVVTPWIMRNISVSGTPLGTAGYALVEGTVLFPDTKLERALEPNFRSLGLKPFFYKLSINSRAIIQDELPKMGGSWVAGLFLAGLLLSYRNPALVRLRYFLLASLIVFLFVQALGRTHLTGDSPVLNTENLLIILVPVIFIFGAGLFNALLDQINLKIRELRLAIIVVFGVMMCLPMAFIFLPPKTTPLVYPPYYPPAIQQTCNWMKPNELMMSDIPWAMAWYGNRQCIWLTANAESQFYAVHDFMKPVKGLYITPKTMDSRFLSEWVRAAEHSWATFILEFIVRRQVSDKFKYFPLRYSPDGFVPEQLFLSDYDRWSTEVVGVIAPLKEEDTSKPAEKPADKTTEKPPETK